MVAKAAAISGGPSPTKPPPSIPSHIARSSGVSEPTCAAQCSVSISSTSTTDGTRAMIAAAGAETTARARTRQGAVPMARSTKPTGRTAPARVVEAQLLPGPHGRGDRREHLGRDLDGGRTGQHDGGRLEGGQ